MSVSRYNLSSSIPQPIRKILASNDDVLHPYKMGERIDNLAQKYWNEPTAGWIIMCANPQWDNEFEIPFGAQVRIPMPLQRIFDQWMGLNQI